jgi:hypothetical protein
MSILTERTGFVNARHPNQSRVPTGTRLLPGKINMLDLLSGVFYTVCKTWQDNVLKAFYGFRPS